MVNGGFLAGYHVESSDGTKWERRSMAMYQSSSCTLNGLGRFWTVSERRSAGVPGRKGAARM